MQRGPVSAMHYLAAFSSPSPTPLTRTAGGKLNRGLTVVHVLQAIKGPAFTEAEAHRAAVLGWCIEWLQAFFLVADDVMDASITRRGQPCWYKVRAVCRLIAGSGWGARPAPLRCNPHARSAPPLPTGACRGHDRRQRRHAPAEPPAQAHQALLWQ